MNPYEETTRNSLTWHDWYGLKYGYVWRTRDPHITQITRNIVVFLWIKTQFHILYPYTILWTRFRTSAAKEYPAGLCSALIHASLDGLRTRSRSEGCRECFSSQLEERELTWIRTMEDAGHRRFASTFLPDYQPNTGWRLNLLRGLSSVQFAHQMHDGTRLASHDCGMKKYHSISLIHSSGKRVYALPYGYECVYIYGYLLSRYDLIIFDWYCWTHGEVCICYGSCLRQTPSRVLFPSILVNCITSVISMENFPNE